MTREMRGIVILVVFAGSALGAMKTWNAGDQLTANDLNANFKDLDDRLKGLETQTVPPGTIVAFAGDTSPPGWIICDGQVLSKVTYPELFAAIGERWGDGGDASGPLFSTPDLRGTFLRGADPLDKTGRDPAGARQVGGVMQVDQFGSHDHPLTDPGHTHGYPWNAGSQNPTGAVIQSAWSASAPNVVNSATTGITMAKAGGPETRPKNFAVSFIIKL